MARTSVHLERAFATLPTSLHLSTAATRDYDAVEFTDLWDRNTQELRDELLLHGLKVSCMSAPPPNYTGGSPGWAADPQTQSRFQSDLHRVGRYAQVLRPAMIELGLGPARGATAIDTLSRNIQYATQTLPGLCFGIPIFEPNAPSEFWSELGDAIDVVSGVADVGLILDAAWARKLGYAPDRVWDAVGDHILNLRVTKADTETGFAQGLDRSGFDGWITHV
ncbi:MAG: hypothetical protein AAFO93_04025 [Pseudomonadota bacterium]